MADNEKFGIEEIETNLLYQEEEDYLALMLGQIDSNLVLFNPDTPSGREELNEIIKLNQIAAAEIDANRKLVSVDPITGEEEWVDKVVDPVAIGRTWEYDFNNLKFSGNGTPIRLQDNDIRIIMQWINRAVSTERYRYQVYPDWFGVELGPIWRGELVGIPALNHVRNTITEAIMVHDRITAVENVSVAEDSGTMYVSCEVFIDNHEQAREVSFVYSDGEFVNG